MSRVQPLTVNFVLRLWLCLAGVLGNVDRLGIPQENGTEVLGVANALQRYLLQASVKDREADGTSAGKSGGRIDSLELDEDAERNLDGELLSTWWPHGSHWQDPVNPFVEERDFNVFAIGLRDRIAQPSEKPSGLANYLPRAKPRTTIPKIFHQVYLDGEESLQLAEKAAEESAEKWPPVKGVWREACKKLHPDWEFKLWNLTAMVTFLEEHYPWFLPTFQAYPERIHRVDAVRPFLMHTFGGVYIDLDVECVQPVDPFLEDNDLVFQMEDFGLKSLVNSAIAGAPGLLFWEIWQRVIAERAGQLQRPKSFFERRDKDVIAVLNATGPWALRAAFETFSLEFGPLKLGWMGSWIINGTRTVVYPLGTWYVPCLWNNVECHSLVEGMIADSTWPIWIAGHHKNAGSWFKAAGFSRTQPWFYHPIWRAAVFSILLSLFWLLWWRRRSCRLSQRGPLESTLPTGNAKHA